MTVLIDTNVALDALLNNADYIVTRNTQDFSSGHIPAITPEQFMRIIADIEQ